MKVLHVTPHLGGGVGKAHAAMRGVFPAAVEQTFVLLESPRDRRYADAIQNSAARVVVAECLDDVARLARQADIVQFEFWNHPRLFECLARCAFSPMRSVFWSHISGLNQPFVPAGLMENAMRFVLTTQASLEMPALAFVSEAARGRLGVINSGFGFARSDQLRPPAAARKPAIAYLGTVDFVKMHPGFFDVIDRLTDSNVRVSVWGDFDRSGAVAARARGMRHPQRVTLGGATTRPAEALSQADIFFYPLQPGHYGSAENVLVEAMSLGLVPLVLNNAAETAIVRHGETGFVAPSIEACVPLLEMLLAAPDTRRRVSRNAAAAVAEHRTAERSARAFMTLWLGLLAQAPQSCDFHDALGETPADWFLATQYLPGVKPARLPQAHAARAAKGTLTHFENAFAGDASLRWLRTAITAA
jgi:glycosyltransferase involved in cell wall biosynthesis